MAYRVQTDAQGNIVNTGNPLEGNGTPEQRPPTSSATYHPHAPRTRVYYDQATGETSVEELGASSYQEKHPVNPGGVKVSRSGQFVPLSMAQAGDLIDFGGERGNTSVDAAVQIGWLVPVPGGGYAIPGAQGQQSQQQQKLQTPEEKAKADQDKADAAASSPNDVKGVPPTSAESDQVVRTMSERAPVLLEAAVQALASGKDVAKIWQDAESSTGEQGFASKAQAMHQQYLASGQQVLRNVGVNEGAFAEFESWAQTEHPEEAGDAIRAMVTRRDVSKLAALGRRFVSQSDNRMVQILNAHNLNAKLEDGTIILSRKALGLPLAARRGDFPAHDRISLKQAIADGHLEIS